MAAHLEQVDDIIQEDLSAGDFDDIRDEACLDKVCEGLESDIDNPAPIEQDQLVQADHNHNEDIDDQAPIEQGLGNDDISEEIDDPGSEDIEHLEPEFFDQIDDGDISEDIDDPPVQSDDDSEAEIFKCKKHGCNATIQRKSRKKNMKSYVQAWNAKFVI